MKTIISSVAFQDERGNALVNGSIILTLPQGIYEITAGGGQVPGSSAIINLDATAKIPAATQLWASDELTPQMPYNVTICAGANGASPLGSSSWLISGASPIDLSLMVATTVLTPSYAAPVLQTPTTAQTITGQPLTLSSSAPLTVQGTASIKNLENIRYADQFATISAAIADLGGLGGVVHVPSGTYSDNIVLSNNYTYIVGDGIGKTIIKPANTALPVVTIDATNSPGGALDSCGISDVSIYPVSATSCDAGLQIKGSTVTNQPNDHHNICRVEIGGTPFVAVNTTGTNNFRVGLEIIGRTIWSVFDRVSIRGTRGDGLKVLLTGGVVGPVNACKFTKMECTNNYGYGINWNTAGAVTLAENNEFDNPNIEANCNNTALTPAAGAVFQGIDTLTMLEPSFEENCAGSADTNRAHLRLTGANARCFNVLGGAFTNDTGTSAKYGIFADCSGALNGLWIGMEFIGTAFTRAIHVAMPYSGEYRRGPIIGSCFNMGVPEFVADAFGNTTAMSLSPLAFPVWQIGNAAFPITANVLDLTDGANATPGNVLSLVSGPNTVSKITNATAGQVLWLTTASGAANTITNAAGGAGQITLRDGANRTLAAGDWLMLYSQDGSTWKEVGLGSSLLGTINTWTQNQSFNGLFTKYNGLTTVSGGVPSELATVDLTGQTAAIATTTLITAPVAGQYRLTWNAKVTTAAATSSTLGPLTVTYTDPDGVAVTFVPAFAINGSTPTLTGQTTNNTQTIEIGLPMLLNVKSGSNITYSFAYASNLANTMAYNLHIKLELM